MAELVKTTLLKALETALNNVVGLAAVYREFELPFDLEEVDANGEEVVPKPALFFWEAPEEVEEDNLYVRNTLHLTLATFFKLAEPDNDLEISVFQIFADEADAIAGQIQNLMQDRSRLAAWQSLGLLNMIPVAQNKALANEKYGEMSLTYRLTYWHRLGDASSLDLH